MNITSFVVCMSVCGAILPASAQTDAELAEKGTIHIFVRAPASNPIPSLQLDGKNKLSTAERTSDGDSVNQFGARTPDPLRAGPKIDIHF
jgi:hypothetical protein